MRTTITLFLIWALLIMWIVEAYASLLQYRRTTKTLRRLKKGIRKLDTYLEAVSAVPGYSTQPRTIILPGLPHLEWMTENLKGFGGTEIDGRTYYTYDEAVEAVKQLGNGWRLPTRDEMVYLDELGSEWQEDGPHGLPGRLFGGGLFLDASGYRERATGALTDVGTDGLYWSSSRYFSAGNTIAGSLSFHSTNVFPLNAGSGANAFSVRCVRNK
ncbi:MAG: hypothetical protein NC226_09565 [Bacteroides cellulosilyticus]|nr:hypothetical protein [Bacteroides cellulosilyticus]